MATFLKKSNNFKTVLAADVAIDDTTITVASIANAPASFDYNITIWDEDTYADPGDDPNMEIVKATAASGTTLTVTRAQEDTSAAAHTNGDRVSLLLTKAQMDELESAINSHGHTAGDGGELTKYLLVDGTRDLTGDWTISTNDVTLTNGKITTATGQIARLGLGIAPDTIRPLLVADTITDQIGDDWSQFIQTVVQPAGAITGQLRAASIYGRTIWDSTEDGAGTHKAWAIGGRFFAETLDDGATGNIEGLIGASTNAIHYGIGTVTYAIGIRSLIENLNDYTENGDITSAYNFHARLNTTKTTGVVAERMGFIVLDGEGGGLLTDQYGLHVADLTAGTNNYAVYLAGSGIDNGVHMGGDVVFYRSAANVGRTSDSFQIDGTLGIQTAPDPTRGINLALAALDTTDTYHAARIEFTKTAGATDHDDALRGMYLGAIYNQAAGEIGYLQGLVVETQHDAGDIGDAVNTRYLRTLYALADLNSGVINGDVYVSEAHFDQEAAHEVTGNVYVHYIEADADGTVGGTVYMLYGKERDGVDYFVYHDGTAPSVIGGTLRVDNKVIFTQVDGNEYIDSLADGYMDYGATTAHRFNNKVGIKTTTPALELDITGQFGIKPSGSGFPTSLMGGYPGQFYAVHAGGNWGFVLARAAADTGGANLAFYHTRNANAATKTALVDGDMLGRFTFQGATSAAVVNWSGEIRVEVNGAVSSGVLPTDIVFSTAATGDIVGGSERLRIKSDGGILMLSLKSGATQGAAGAAADELWETNGHATLPDHVVLIGV